MKVLVGCFKYLCFNIFVLSACTQPFTVHFHTDDMPDDGDLGLLIGPSRGKLNTSAIYLGQIP